MGDILANDTLTTAQVTALVNAAVKDEDSGNMTTTVYAVWEEEATYTINDNGNGTTENVPTSETFSNTDPTTAFFAVNDAIAYGN